MQSIKNISLLDPKHISPLLEKAQIFGKYQLGENARHLIGLSFIIIFAIFNNKNINFKIIN